MRSFLYFIIFAYWLQLLQAQDNSGYNPGTNFGVGKSGFQQNNVSLDTFYAPVFEGFDTNGFMHSPYTNTWLQLNGLQRGSFLRLINSDTATRPLFLPAARTDTATITFWLKVNLPRKTGAWIISNKVGSGWGLAFHNNYGNGLEFNYQGITGGLLIQTLAATDSLRRYYKIKVNNLGLSGARVRVYYSTNGTDSLKLDTTNALWILSANNSGVTAATIGCLNAQNNISDTSQQSTSIDTYASVEFRDLTVRKEWNGSDTIIGPLKSLGYGQMVYDSSRINTFSWDRGNWSGTIPQQNFNMGLGLFGETPNEINGTRLKDPVLWNQSGAPFACMEGLGKGFANFNVDSSYRESYTNASCIKFWDNDFYFVVGAALNVINFSTSSNGKTYSRRLARRNMTTGEWTAFNQTNYPLNNVVSVLDINDSIMYVATIDSILDVARTKGISQYNWNTDVYTAIDSGMNEGGQGLRLYKSGNANFLGGLFSTLGNTTSFGSCAIQRGYGTEWKPLGTGSNNTVWSFIVTPAGDTIVAGQFSSFNGVPVNSICRWNGTTAVALGNGLTDSAGNPGVVFDMEWYNGMLVVCGDFHVAGTVGALNIAAWNGTSWVNIGNIYRSNPNFWGQVTEMDVNDTYNWIIIGGTFNKIDYQGVLRTSYNNVVFNGDIYFAAPPPDQRVEGAIWYTASQLLIDGDETGAGGLDVYNGGSNGCHQVNVTAEMYTQ